MLTLALQALARIISSRDAASSVLGSRSIARCAQTRSPFKLASCADDSGGQVQELCNLPEIRRGPTNTIPKGAPSSGSPRTFLRVFHGPEQLRARWANLGARLQASSNTVPRCVLMNCAQYELPILCCSFPRGRPRLSIERA
eukprot:4566566-Pyramimonas_sp.AAC.1